MDIQIETKELSKWFNEVVALNNVTVQITSGVIGLLGPNGAGKSTFIKLALGLYRPSRGEIRVLGERPRNNFRIISQVGYCPEMDHFVEEVSGFEFLYWLARYSGLVGEAGQKRVKEVLEQVRMTDRMYDPIATYSKGMRQRIKVAQALLHDPQILFLDEPMNGLDPSAREDLFNLVIRLGNEGKTVIFSSHVLHEVERVTDTVILIYNGRVLAFGKIRDIRDLIKNHPRTIVIETLEPKKIYQLLSFDTNITTVNFEAQKLTVHTLDPIQTFKFINEIVVDGKVPIYSFRCADEDLQSVFQYLISTHIPRGL
ncbi:MAG: ABC transporter ATP-binding protein [Candidatus Hydrogenedens sp.]|nr:ABC transporter ATP-binding protein [Candidatus Hydrogenedens sp.]